MRVAWLTEQRGASERSAECDPALVAARWTGQRLRRGLGSAQPLMKASKSALITSAFVAPMPWGKPLYTFKVLCLSSLADSGAESAKGTIWSVVTVRDEHRDVDLLQVFGEVGLRESLDAIVVGFRAAHHALAPPIVDDGLGHFRAGRLKP